MSVNITRQPKKHINSVQNCHLKSTNQIFAQSSIYQYQQQDASQPFQKNTYAKKINNQIKINNQNQKLMRPNRTTENLKLNKKFSYNKQSSINNTKDNKKNKVQRECNHKRKLSNRCSSRSKNSSKSNTSWENSLRSDKTEKKSFKRSPSFKIYGLKNQGIQNSNSNSNSLSLIKSTSRSKHKSPSLSLKKRMEKQTLKKVRNFQFKSTQIPKKKKQQKKFVEKKKFNENFQISEEVTINERKPYKINQSIRRFMERKKNKERVQNLNKMKQQTQKNIKKKQDFQKLQIHRKYNLKNSLVHNKSRSKVLKNSIQIPQDGQSYFLSPIYNYQEQIQNVPIKNYKKTNKNSQEKQNKKAKIQHLMRTQNALNGLKYMNVSNQNNLQCSKIEKQKQSIKIQKKIFFETINKYSTNIFQKYQKGIASSRDFYWLVSAAIKIQKVWRGYRTRKMFYQSLQKQDSSYQKTKRQSSNEFWFNDSSSSILQFNEQIIDSASREQRIKRVQWILPEKIKNKVLGLIQQQKISSIRQNIPHKSFSIQQQQCPKELQNLIRKLKRNTKFTKPSFVNKNSLQEQQPNNEQSSNNNSKRFEVQYQQQSLNQKIINSKISQQIKKQHQNKDINRKQNKQHEQSQKIRQLKQQLQQKQIQKRKLQQRLLQMQSILQKQNQQKLKKQQIHKRSSQLKNQQYKQSQDQKKYNQPLKNNFYNKQLKIQIEEYQISSSRIPQPQQSQQFTTPKPYNNHTKKNNLKNQNQQIVYSSSSIKNNNSHTNTIQISNYETSQYSSQLSQFKKYEPQNQNPNNQSNNSSEQCHNIMQKLQQYKKKLHQQQNSHNNSIYSITLDRIHNKDINVIPPEQFHSPRSSFLNNHQNFNNNNNLNNFTDDRINHLFWKKKVKVDQIYQKKLLRVQDLYQKKMISPKSYQQKVFTFKQNCNQQKQQIENKFKEASNVIQFLKDVQNQCSPREFRENQNPTLKASNQSSFDKRQNLMSPIECVQNNNFASPSPMKAFYKLSDLQQSASIQNIKNQIKKAQQQKQKYSATKFIPVQQTKNTDKKNVGFQTDISYIKTFCVKLSDFVREHDKNRVWVNINTPIQQNDFLMLQAYRTNEQLQHVSDYNIFVNDMLYPFLRYIVDVNTVIDKQVFNEFVKSLQRSKKFQNNEDDKIQNSDQQSQDSDIQVMKLYFYQLLFDAFNQAMEYQRPFGTQGKGFLWSKKIKKLNNKNLQQKISNKQNMQEKFNQFFGKSIMKMMQWCRYMCGLNLQSSDFSTSNIYQDSQKELRQKRMALMLENYIMQRQQGMKDIQDQITQTKLFLAQQIFNQVINDLIKDKNFKLYFM